MFFCYITESLISLIVPKPNTKPATFPAGKTNADIEQACATTPFPTLSTDPGPETSVPAV